MAEGQHVVYISRVRPRITIRNEHILYSVYNVGQTNTNSEKMNKQTRTSRCKNVYTCTNTIHALSLTHTQKERKHNKTHILIHIHLKVHAYEIIRSYSIPQLWHKSLTQTHLRKHARRYIGITVLNKRHRGIRHKVSR